jgi:hypothetical protein
MNYLHLQETARHYAKLAEQARVDLQEVNELNSELFGLIEALCEELDIDVETLLEMAMTKAGHAARVAREWELSAQGKRGREQSWRSQNRTDRWLRSDQVYDAEGNVVHKGARGLGSSITTRDPSDEDIKNVKRVVGEVGHIVGVAKGDYATGPGDTGGTIDHPVHRRLETPKAGGAAKAPAQRRAAVKKTVNKTVKKK